MLRWILYALCTLFYLVPIVKAENSIEQLSAYIIAEHYAPTSSASLNCAYKINNLALSPNGRHLATSGYYSTTNPVAFHNAGLKLWDIGNIEAIQEIHYFLDNDQLIGSLAFSPDGQHLLATQGESIILRDVQTGTEVKRFSGHTETVRNATFSADGRFIVSGQECTISNSQINLCTEPTALLKVWDVATAQEIWSINVPASSINAVEFSPDGHFVVSGHGCEERPSEHYLYSMDSFIECIPESPTLIAWNAKTGEKIRTFNSYGNEVSTVGFLPNKQFIFSRSNTASNLWDFATGKELLTLESPAFSGFSPDGHFLISSLSNFNYMPTGLAIWDAATGQQIEFNKTNFESFTADGFYNGNFSTVFSSDSHRLYSGGTADCTLRVWDFNFPEIPENNHEPPQPPHIYALTNQTNYTAGDMFQFRFRTQNTSTKHYDAYVALLFPDNHFLTFESWLIPSRQQITAIFNQVMPYFTDKALDIAYQYPILELQLPPETPKGHYQGCAVLTEAGSNILQGEHWVSSHCTGFMVQ